MKLCKDCEYLKMKTPPTDALIDRYYRCNKYSWAIILKKPEDVETLECVENNKYDKGDK